MCVDSRMRKPYMIIMITDHTRQTYLEQNMETYWDNLQQSGVGNCHFNGIYNVFEFEHLIFHGICSTLVLKLFMRHASLQLGFM